MASVIAAARPGSDSPTGNPSRLASARSSGRGFDVRFSTERRACGCGGVSFHCHDRRCRTRRARSRSAPAAPMAMASTFSKMADARAAAMRKCTGTVARSSATSAVAAPPWRSMPRTRAARSAGPSIRISARPRMLRSAAATNSAAMTVWSAPGPATRRAELKPDPESGSRLSETITSLLAAFLESRRSLVFKASASCLTGMILRDIEALCTIGYNQSGTQLVKWSRAPL